MAGEGGGGVWYQTQDTLVWKAIAQVTRPTLLFMLLFVFHQNDPTDESGYPIVKHGKLCLVDLAGKNKIIVFVVRRFYRPSYF